MTINRDKPHLWKIDWVWEHRTDDLGQALGQSVQMQLPPLQESPVAYLTSVQRREHERMALQRRIDSLKSPESRNRLGQFSTPFPLARQMVAYASAKLSSAQPVAFIEPALGTGVFYSALMDVVGERPLHKAIGIELDQDYAHAAQSLWSGDEITILVADFLGFAIDPRNAGRFDLLCTNPPYVRHHHIASSRKLDLQARIKSSLGLTVSGLAGLYLYFILMAHEVLAADAIASWLIPSEFLVVNYGTALRDYFTRHVTLLALHQFNTEDVQFDDALVSSCVVTYRKRRPTAQHRVRFTSGADIAAPTRERILDLGDPELASRWTVFARPAAGRSDSAASAALCIGDLFEIKRGIATGANDFFVIDQERATQYAIPQEFLRPILPGPRLVRQSIIAGDHDGIPTTTPQLFLLACDQPPEIVEQEFPTLWSYLQIGVQQAIHMRYLCESKDVWYFQERRLPSRYLASYMGRSNGGTRSPIRFFLNHSLALVTNVYLHLYPRPHLAAPLAEDEKREIELLDVLNAIPVTDILHAGRTYGGGLHKLEPKELAAVPVAAPPDWLHGVVFKQLAML